MPRATNLAFTTTPTSIFVLAEVNGVMRLRQCLPVNIPSSGSAAAAQASADAAQTTANAALPKAGGPMTGDIAMGGNKVTGLGAPSAGGDATNKTYVDNAVATAKIFRLGIACSDETTALTTGLAKVTFRMPCAVTLTAVRASLTTTSSSGIPTIDINENGSTILSTKLTIDVGEKTSTTAAVPPVISDSALADDAEMTVDIDVAGTGATGLKIFLIGTFA